MGHADVLEMRERFRRGREGDVSDGVNVEAERAQSGKVLGGDDARYRRERVVGQVESVKSREGLVRRFGDPIGRRVEYLDERQRT